MVKTPTEHEEACVLADYLDCLGLQYTKTAQETFTRSWKQKNKNKAEGVKPGLPDYIIVINGKLVFIELKRKKGGTVSLHQKKWIEELNKCEGVVAEVCRGADEAIELINNIRCSTRKKK